MYQGFSFEVKHRIGNARHGVLETPHGCIETPAFIFCGTKASIKGMHMQDVIKEGTQILLANTYHLMLQPGEDLIHEHGGLHNFMQWHGPMMTDSGGFQIFSLGHGSVSSEIKGSSARVKKSLVKITNEGANFSSYINGDAYFLTPRKSMEIQVKLGADLCFAFDECTPFHSSKKYTEKSMHRSHVWEKESLESFIHLKQTMINISGDYKSPTGSPQALYGIVQGGVYEDLRTQSVDFISSEGFFGNAIGGSLGGSVEQMYEVVDFTSAGLRKTSYQRPIHLLGIGRMKDILYGVSRGIDTFDCVHPTRIARHGGALISPDWEEASSILQKLSCSSNNSMDVITAHPIHSSPKEHINLNNACFRSDQRPLEEECGCSSCMYYSRAYIHHLLKAKEILAHTAITAHNIHVMNKFMRNIRQWIQNNSH